MQSKTSFFNRTLFRKNLSRYWPLWGFASFVGFLAPAALLVRVIQSGETSVEPLVVREGYYYLLGNAVPIISLCYAILCAMAVWSYLYNARSVGMMHTLPIRREGLFLTNLLSGLISWPGAWGRSSSPAAAALTPGVPSSPSWPSSPRVSPSSALPPSAPF